jgi:hypothetical protein
MEETMTYKGIAWGLGGMACLGLTLACSGTRLNNVGDVTGEAGSDASGGSTIDPEGPEAGAGVGAGGNQGTGNQGSGATGSDAGAPNPPNEGGAPSRACFNDFLHGMGSLQLGPNNAVFGVPRDPTETIENYAGQQVFPDAFEILANFPPADGALVTNTDVSFPLQLATIADNVGEIRLTREVCKGEPAAGRTIQIQAFWKLNGAIGRSPTEGLALGADVDGERVYFEDATKAFVIGEPDHTRPLNTLAPLVLEHTFTEEENVDAGELFLNVWLIEDFVFPSTFYVYSVTWDED